MKKIATPLEGMWVLEPKVWADARGFFMETYKDAAFKELGLSTTWVQDNHSRSVKNTLRGLHYQKAPHGQAKLVRCTRGAIWDVGVDIRPGSKTFGKWHAVELSEENKLQLLLPEGFAHGFCVLSDEAEVQYKCSSLYHPASDAGLAWNDPDVAIAWPISSPLLSDKDTKHEGLAQLRARL